MADLPYYIDDPMVDRAAHRLDLHRDENSPADWAVFGSCSCGEWTTPTWDCAAVQEAFDLHMRAVQHTAHLLSGQHAPPPVST